MRLSPLERRADTAVEVGLYCVFWSGQAMTRAACIHCRSINVAIPIPEPRHMLMTA
jgi:hypothetical protein